MYMLSISVTVMVTMPVSYKKVKVTAFVKPTNDEQRNRDL